MLAKTKENQISKAFSRAAGKYETLAALQKEVGLDILEKVQDKKECERILDVGMGTGWLTNKLADLYPAAHVLGIDFASGMVEYAREKYNKLSVIQADAAAIPFKEAVFDVVVSNLAYQWVDNLEKAFKLSYSSLNEDGLFCFSVFGKNTLPELHTCLQKTFAGNNGNKMLAIRRLPEETAVVDAVQQAGFKIVEQGRNIRKVYFSDMMDLIRWLKDIGSNAIERNFYIGKNKFLQANEYYKQNFSDKQSAHASFEVIWIMACK